MYPRSRDLHIRRDPPRTIENAIDQSDMRFCWPAILLEFQLLLSRYLNTLSCNVRLKLLLTFFFSTTYETWKLYYTGWPTHDRSQGRCPQRLWRMLGTWIIIWYLGIRYAMHLCSYYTGLFGISLPLSRIRVSASCQPRFLRRWLPRSLPNQATTCTEYCF